MIRRPPRSTLSSSSAASDVYKRQNGKPSMIAFDLADGVRYVVSRRASSLGPIQSKMLTPSLRLEVDIVFQLSISAVAQNWIGNVLKAIGGVQTSIVFKPVVGVQIVEKRRQV